MNEKIGRQLGELISRLTVNQVFGPPVELDGVVVLPVAEITGGGGGGGGRSPSGGKDASTDVGSEAAPEDQPAEVSGSELGGKSCCCDCRVDEAEIGGGGGFGFSARPVGAWVIENGRARWRPVMDVRRLVQAGMAVSLAAAVVCVAVLRRGARRSRREARQPR
jgi:uncharacterized spore protein YtfJ